MVIRPFVKNLFILAISLLLLLPAAAQQPAVLVVAWADGGSLFAWQQGALPIQIATGNVIRPYLSPDGQRAAFVSGHDLASYSLRVVNIDGTGEIILSLPGEIRERAVHQITWADETVFYFNTIEAADYGLALSDNLYRADVVTGQVEPVLTAGEGGNFTISPDARWIGVVQAGSYGSLEGQIGLVNRETGEKRSLLRFPAVSTGSEYAFYPGITWETDSQALRAALPDPDLINNDAEGQTVLWRLGVDGTAIPLGVVTASFFGQPQWSSDLSQMLFSRRVGAVEANQVEMVIADGSGANPEVYLPAAPAGSFDSPRWIPGTNYFGYAGSSLGQYWIGGLGQRPQLFPNDMELVFDPHWVSDGVMVFYTPPTDEGSELRYALLVEVGQPSERIVAVNDLFPAFSAVLKGAPGVQ